jgi:hypothetical protein
VDEEDPESYRKWSAARFEERLLKIFPDKGQRPADADSIVARVSSIPCHFRAEQNFESATAYLEKIGRSWRSTTTSPWKSRPH